MEYDVSLKTIPKANDYFTETEFKKSFGDDDACILWLCLNSFPNGIVCKKCNKVTTHKYYKAYQSFQCEVCGTHYQPILGTIYQKKGIPISKWFFAIYLIEKNLKMTSQELSKKIDVDLKTAEYIIAKYTNKLNT